MKIILSLTVLTAVFLATACTTAPTSSSMQRGVEVTEPWARATPPVAESSAAYMQLLNTADEPDRLLSADSDVARSVELHTHVKEEDMLRMAPVDAIDIPAGGSTVLEPRGLHVMLIDLQQSLEEGDQFPLELTFEKAGTMTVNVPVRRGAMAAPGMSHEGMKDHDMTEDSGMDGM